MPRSRWARAPASDCSQALPPLEAADAERAPAVRRGAAPRPTRGSGLLPRDQRAAREEVLLEVRVHLGVTPPVPLQQHGEVLLLLVAVVGQDLLQSLVGRRVDALIVPVRRLQLFLHGGERPVVVQGLRPQLAFRFVVSRRVRHHRSSERLSARHWSAGRARPRYPSTDSASTLGSRASRGTPAGPPSVASELRNRAESILGAGSGLALPRPPGRLSVRRPSGAP